MSFFLNIEPRVPRANVERLLNSLTQPGDEELRSELAARLLSSRGNVAVSKKVLNQISARFLDSHNLQNEAGVTRWLQFGLTLSTLVGIFGALLIGDAVWRAILCIGSLVATTVILVLINKHVIRETL